MIRAITFDLDNTLIDFYTMKVTASHAALDAMIQAGLNMDQEEARTLLFQLYDEHGWEHQEILQKFLEHTHNSIDYKLLASGILAYRQAKAGQVKAYSGVLPTLQELKQQYKLAIVTDAPRLQAWMRLTEMGLQDLFDTVITFDDTGQRKPSNLPFQKALDELCLKPDEVLHVGDHPLRDIQGAKALGMKTAFAKYGGNDNTAEADYTLEKIEDLLRVTRAY